jgi:uncharacterized protein
MLLCSMSARRMYRTFSAILILSVSHSAMAMPFINEFHYDNSGTDTGEFIEIAAATSFDLTGWELWRYNGSGGAPYGNGASGSGTATGLSLSSFSSTAANDSGGLRFYSFNFNTDGIQNGAPDGFALVGPSSYTGGIGGGRVLQFLSYEGSFAGNGGPANGLSSTSIGVDEVAVPVGFSLQLGGTGTQASDFTWRTAALSTSGAVNREQVISLTGGGGGTRDVAIYTIQGTAQRSSLDGQSVRTTGIVTAVTTNGFYLQDSIGDGDVGTSDAIFVFTSSAPTVSVGDGISVTGNVGEFTPSGTVGSLSITQIQSPAITFVSSGNSLPSATVIGAAGRTPPTSKIDSDGLTISNPLVDGIDFYESLEGMRVTVADARAVSSTIDAREFYVVANQGTGATRVNSRGGITLGASDQNPERIQIDAGFLTGGVAPNVNTGDKFGDITGVVGYRNGNFEVLPTAINVTSGGLQRTVASVPSGGDRLTVASYNVENLDTSQPARFAALAAQITTNLRNPDIIALQEIRESGDTRAVGAAIVAALRDAGINNYAYTDGGAAGANGGSIRVGYLYRTDRVSLPSDAIVRDDAVFDNFRPALEARFVFNGQDITLINNHFAAKVGSTPLYGTIQPPIDGRDTVRASQASFINNLVDGILASNPLANVIVLGDLNDFSFSAALAALRGSGADQALFDLADQLLDALEAYSYNFEGNAQLLDHILVSGGLLALDPRLEIVRLNSEFWDKFSDHDPLLASFLVRAVPEAPPLSLFVFAILAMAVVRQRRRMA